MFQVIVQDLNFSILIFLVFLTCFITRVYEVQQLIGEKDRFNLQTTTLNLDLRGIRDTGPRLPRAVPTETTTERSLYFYDVSDREEDEVLCQKQFAVINLVCAAVFEIITAIINNITELVEAVR